MIATKRFHSASKHSSKYLHHLRFEPLESRQLLSVTPAAIVGSSALPMAAPEAGNIQLSAIGTEADGKTICFGDWDGTGRSDSPEVLARFNANGTLDTTFGKGGEVVVDLSGWTALRASAIQPDGKILLVGETQSSPVLFRFNADGTLDATFGTGGHIDCPAGGATALLVQPDGRILVGTGDILARYNADGSFDSTFGHGGMVVTTNYAAGQLDTTGGFTSGSLTGSSSVFSSFAVSCFQVQADGKILVGGGSENGVALFRCNSDGTLDTSFGDGGVVVQGPSNGWVTSEGKIQDIVVQPDGKILAVGATYQGDGFIDRFHADGTVDAGFGQGGAIRSPETNISDVVVLPDGRIVATSAPDFQEVLTRYRTDGSLDPTFGNKGNLSLQTGYGEISVQLQVLPDGSLVALGGTGEHFATSLAILPGQDAPTAPPPVWNGFEAHIVDSVQSMVLFDATSVVVNKADAIGISTGADDPCLVTTAKDVVDPNDGLTSLREAVAYANSHAGADTITFAAGLSGQTISLSAGELDITDTTGLTTIIGQAVVISAVSDPSLPATFRIFDIASGASADLLGLTIEGGRSSDGGGIYNAGTLTVTDCDIISNHADHEGGAIWNSGSLTVTNTYFEFDVSNPYDDPNGLAGQTTGTQGGAVDNRGTLVVSGSTFTDNVSAQGGAIANHGTMTVGNSTISNNLALQGGGIANRGTFSQSSAAISDNFSPTGDDNIADYTPVPAADPDVAVPSPAAVSSLASNLASLAALNTYDRSTQVAADSFSLKPLVGDTLDSGVSESRSVTPEGIATGQQDAPVNRPADDRILVAVSGGNDESWERGSLYSASDLAAVDQFFGSVGSDWLQV